MKIKQTTPLHLTTIFVMVNFLNGLFSEQNMSPPYRHDRTGLSDTMVPVRPWYENELLFTTGDLLIASITPRSSGTTCPTTKLSIFSFSSCQGKQGKKRKEKKWKGLGYIFNAVDTETMTYAHTHLLASQFTINYRRSDSERKITLVSPPNGHKTSHISRSQSSHHITIIPDWRYPVDKLPLNTTKVNPYTLNFDIYILVTQKEARTGTSEMEWMTWLRNNKILPRHSLVKRHIAASCWNKFS